ncbi:MAG: immunity 26/phosphotriesterase HocA family protein [Sphingobacterium paramultivorum]
MEKPLFELTNEQRKYLGITPVESCWELVKLFENYVYFDGDIIRKEIAVTEQSYIERDLYEKTAENRTILLPKTEKGKPKKLNFTATQAFRGTGVYFAFSDSYLSISSFTTQITYYSERFKDKDLYFLKTWLDKWIAETSEKDLQEIEAFKNAERKQYKYKEGDFFAFKIGRRQWGFGRILIDVQKTIKVNNFQRDEHCGLNHLMGKSLIVKVYHKISNDLNVDLEELSETMALPSQVIMDNDFFYGENPIIGHKPLDASELDMLISYSQSINSDNYDKVYLQYGLIYKEIDISKFNKYLRYEDETLYLGYEENPYRKESTGYGLDRKTLQKCIEAKSNLPYWECKDERYDRKLDLRNPANINIKKDIFKAFGLDADKSYEGNLKIAST